MPPLILIRITVAQRREEDLRHRGNVVHIRLSDHGRHRFVDVALSKFIPAMLVPYCFEIEIWPIEKWFQKCYAAGVRDPRTPLMVVFISWKHPERLFLCVLIAVGFDNRFDRLGC
jgi:hypothetical protein